MADNINITDANGVERTVATKDLANVHFNKNIISDDNGNLVEVTNNGLDTSTRAKPSNGFIAKFNRITNQTTLSANAVQFGSSIEVNDTAGIVDGSYLIVFNPTLNRFSTFRAVGVPVGSVVAIDSQIDVAYPAGSFVDVARTNMNESGTIAAPKIYGLRNASESNPVALIAVVERIIFTCFTTTAPGLDQFGNISTLTNGLLLRRADGTVINTFNVKNNGELAGIMFDWTPTSAIGSGQDGFIARFSFNKFGGSQQLGPNEDLQFLVQDDLSTGPPSIELLEITAEGYLI